MFKNLIENRKNNVCTYHNIHDWFKVIKIENSNIIIIEGKKQNLEITYENYEKECYC